MRDTNTIASYLKIAGLNNNIIKFIKNNHCLIRHIAQLLKDDFICGMNIDQDNCIIKIKNGFDNFKIFDDKNIWIFIKQKNDTNMLYSNNSCNNKDELNKYDEIKTYAHIATENNYIINKKVIFKKYTNKILFDGQIMEEIYDINLNKIMIKNAYFYEMKKEEIPNEYLTTSIQKINNYNFSFIINEKINYNNKIWNFIITGQNFEVNKSFDDNRLSLLNKLKVFKDKILFQEKSNSEKVYINKKS
ncbi:MAG: hypothetical protein PHN42_00200 [Bacilli bacterium]|nr:hypothetical protein [Bacilli bacterium]